MEACSNLTNAFFNLTNFRLDKHIFGISILLLLGRMMPTTQVFAKFIQKSIPSIFKVLNLFCDIPLKLQSCETAFL